MDEILPDYKTYVDINDSVKKRVLRLFRAVKDVSREENHGDLEERVAKRDIVYYGKRDLELAYLIYKELIQYDIKNNAITLELLKIARNPLSLVKQGI